MATAVVGRLVTGEDLVSMAEDGVERWIRAGRLEERPMTTRNNDHSRVLFNLSGHLFVWRRTGPIPSVSVFVGDAAVRLVNEPETTYGIDIAVFSAQSMAAHPAGRAVIEGVPLVAVEILSMSQKIADIEDKIDSLIFAGTHQVWIVNPKRRTVIVYRQQQPPTLFHAGEVLTAEPELPGFSVSVAALFE